MNMIKFLKEEMNESLKEIYVNTNKQWRKVNQSLQDLKVEIESSQTVGNQEIKKFRNSNRNHRGKLHHRI